MSLPSERHGQNNAAYRPFSDAQPQNLAASGRPQTPDEHLSSAPSFALHPYDDELDLSFLDHTIGDQEFNLDAMLFSDRLPHQTCPPVITASFLSSLPGDSPDPGLFGGESMTPSTASSCERTPSQLLPSSQWLSPLHMASHKGHETIVRLLLSQVNVDCNEKDSNGMTPLMVAVVKGHENVVSTLLNHGARVEEVDTSLRSALHWAVFYQHGAVLQTLLQHVHGGQSLVNAYDRSGNTPLHTAIWVGFEAGVQILLSAGADVSIKARGAQIFECQ